MNKNRFFARLRFWLYFAMPQSKLKDYIKAFDEFFARGLLSGRSERELAAALGEPRLLANKLLQADKLCVTHPILRIACAKLILLCIAILFFAGAFTSGKISFAVFFIIVGVVLPVCVLALCGGKRLIMRVQNTSTALATAILNILICAVALLPMCLAVVAHAYDSLAAGAGMAVVVLLIVFLLQTIQIVRYGITCMPLLAMDSALLSIVLAVSNIAACYTASNAALIIETTFTGQMLALSLELLMLTTFLTLLHYFMMKKVLTGENK